MLEFVQFEIDLGELGVTPRTEPGYRQLRASCTGRARDIVASVLTSARGATWHQTLEKLAGMAAPEEHRNDASGQLYALLIQVLEDALRLTPERRVSIALEIDV